MNLEIQNLPRLSFFPGQVSFDLPFELFVWECLVHPGCTNEVGSILTRNLDKLASFCPTHLSKLWLRYSREMFVNRHEVISLPSRINESSLQEFVKGIQLFQSPILFGTDLTQIFSRFHKADILLLFLRLLPRQNLMDSSQHEYARWRLISGLTISPPLIHKLVKPGKVIHSGGMDQIPLN